MSGELSFNSRRFWILDFTPDLRKMPTWRETRKETSKLGRLPAEQGSRKTAKPKERVCYGFEPRRKIVLV